MSSYYSLREEQMKKEMIDLHSRLINAGFKIEYKDPDIAESLIIINPIGNVVAEFNPNTSYEEKVKIYKGALRKLGGSNMEEKEAKKKKDKHMEGKHFKGPKRFDSCKEHMREEGYTGDSPDKICGKIKAKKGETEEIEKDAAKDDMDFGVTSKGKPKKPPTQFQKCKKEKIQQGYSKQQATNVCNSEKKPEQQPKPKTGGIVMDNIKISDDELNQLSYQSLDNIRGQLYDFAEEVLNPVAEVETQPAAEAPKEVVSEG